MFKRTEASNRIALPGQTRLVTVLVAMTCLSVGVAIGAISRGTAGARVSDDRLSITNSSLTPDALSSAFARVAEQVEPAVVHIRVFEGELVSREGTGSGVIVNPTGFILTNEHVVKRATRIKVRLVDGTEQDASIVGVDSSTDLAVIRIASQTPLTAARMGDSDKLRVGEWVLAIGSPFGFEQSVTAGIISAKDRDDYRASPTPFQKFLQTDAAINPGNSGGPLVNMAGEVVGINTQIATMTGFGEGVGFALPSTTAVDVYNQLVTNGRVRRSFLGITLEPVSAQIARINKIPESQGVLVANVTANDSPAALAGIKSGDVILSVNGQKVKTIRELIRTVASLPVGSVARVEYVRDSAQHTALVKLQERVEEGEDRFGNTRPQPSDRRLRPAPDLEENKSERPKAKPGFGLGVKTLTPDLAKMRSIEGIRGAYVFSIEPGSVADDSDCHIDDVITEINYKPVLSAEDFNKLVRELRSGDDVVIKVLRKDRGPLRRAVLISFTMP
jgi:serine protease Do